MTNELATPYILARQAFADGADFRRRRQRQKDFTFGSQWGDLVRGADGSLTTELQTASVCGRQPLTNNIIRNLVKTLTGHLRHSLEEEEDSGADTALLNDLDARTFEEFLISGAAVQRVGGTSATEVEIVSPDRFFYAPFADPLGRDVRLLGMLHDWSLPDVMARFAGGDFHKAAEIRKIYTLIDANPPSLAVHRKVSFSQADQGRCRVIEVWEYSMSEQIRCLDPLKSTAEVRSAADFPKIEAENRRRARNRRPRIDSRWEMVSSWVGHWYSPSGIELHREERPRHPFVFRLYPMIDGEVHSFVEDIVDQQKYINRIITHVDNIMAISSKGSLLFPQDQLADGMTWADVASRWTRYDGVIPYNPRPGVPGPQQMIANPSACGASEMLASQIRILEDVSGMSDAYRGRHVSGTGNSAQLYQAQAEAAGTAQADLFATFQGLRRDRAELLKSRLPSAL